MSIENEAFLAPYACRGANSRGRFYSEPDSKSRSIFRRDCDRVIHSQGFRRLEYKTQVFVNHEGDHYRTRLTHSLEVAQIARSLARNLGLNEDLCEVLALAHDLGHTPFGHAGEDALSVAMKDFGGFSHNVQTFRIVTQLEQSYPDFDGLNLSWETIEGLIKHNGPLIGPHRDQLRYPEEGVADSIATIDREWNLQLDSFPSLEAQLAGLADDIAYNNHDLDDGIRAGLFTLESLREVPLLEPIISQVFHDVPNADMRRKKHEVIRRLMGTMIDDLIFTTQDAIAQSGVAHVDDIRKASHMFARFSDAMEEKHQQLKEFLMENMYRHFKVCRMTSKAKRLVADLFNILFQEPECLPKDWQHEDLNDPSRRALQVSDFIAGMTDRFALEEYERLFHLSKKS